MHFNMSTYTDNNLNKTLKCPICRHLVDSLKPCFRQDLILFEKFKHFA